MELSDARAEWIAFRKAFGFSGDAALLTPPDANAKLAKSDAPTYGLTLAAAAESARAADVFGPDAVARLRAVGITIDGVNVCTWSTPDCRLACVLVTAGNARFPGVARARIVRTLFLADHPDAFLTLLVWELRKAVTRHGSIVARLNVASDIRWERIAPQLFTIPGVRFYDYTKAPVTQRTETENYRLTYSVSERPQSTSNALAALEGLANAAVVFERTPAGLPETWNGFRVIDGDASDDRTTDPVGTVVGLLAKGSARFAVGTPEGFIKPAVAS
jgi:hypothetical protein